MPNLFSSGAGKVAQLAGNGLPMALRIGNVASPDPYAAFNGFSVLKSIVTGLSFQEQSGYQLMHTLNQFLYIYNFGERAADLTINGLCFMGNCNDDTDPNTGKITTATGIEQMILFYKNNRLSTLGAPMAIAIGARISLYGFLVGLRVELADPNMGIAQFTMIFKCPPHD